MGLPQHGLPQMLQLGEASAQHGGRSRAGQEEGSDPPRESRDRGQKTEGRRRDADDGCARRALARRRRRRWKKRKRKRKERRQKRKKRKRKKGGCMRKVITPRHTPRPAIFRFRPPDNPCVRPRAAPADSRPGSPRGRRAAKARHIGIFPAAGTRRHTIERHHHHHHTLCRPYGASLHAGAAGSAALPRPLLTQAGRTECEHMALLPYLALRRHQADAAGAGASASAASSAGASAVLVLPSFTTS